MHFHQFRLHKSRCQCLHHFEGIADLRGVLARVHVGDGDVVLHVANCGLERGSVEVDAEYRLRATCGCVHRERASAREYIEHLRIAGEAADLGAIVALIQEMSGLLTVDHVGFEGETVLAEDHWRGGCRSNEGSTFFEAEHVLPGDVAAETQHDGVC